MFLISIIIIILILFDLVVAIICLSINMKYIQNFMSKINNDFERYNYYYSWTIILIFLIIFYMFCYITIILYLFFIKENSLFKTNLNQLKCYCICKCIYNCCEKCKKKKETDITSIQNDISGKNLNTIGDGSETSSSMENACIICYANQKQITFAPCGHKCICKECYLKNKDTNQLRNCYVCRARIESFIEKIYDG